MNLHFSNNTATEIYFQSRISFYDYFPSVIRFCSFMTIGRFEFVCENLSFITCIIKFMISLTTYFDTSKKICIIFIFFPLPLSFGCCFSLKCTKTSYVAYSTIHKERAMNAFYALHIAIYNSHCN